MLTSDKAPPAVPCAVCGRPSECAVWGETNLCYAGGCTAKYLEALPKSGDFEAGIQAEGGDPHNEATRWAAYRTFTARWLATHRKARAA